MMVGSAAVASPGAGADVSVRVYLLAKSILTATYYITIIFQDAQRFGLILHQHQAKSMTHNYHV